MENKIGLSIILSHIKCFCLVLSLGLSAACLKSPASYWNTDPNPNSVAGAQDQDKNSSGGNSSEEGDEEEDSTDQDIGDNGAMGRCLSDSSPCPLIDMKGITYKGFEGGLYPEGKNTAPASHTQNGIESLENIVPRDINGNPSNGGKIVMTSIGMSNTRDHFCGRLQEDNCLPTSFTGRSNSDPLVNDSLEVVNGAHPAQAAGTWTRSRNNPNYQRIIDRLARKNLSREQVQIIWILQANPYPTPPLPEENADAFLFLENLGKIVRAAKEVFPNLQHVYLSSRIHACEASKKSPEPYAYESGFSVKWLIESQIHQNEGRLSEINQSLVGELRQNRGAPWLSWAAYMWADGANPRSDGLFWSVEDREADCTHPSAQGAEKGAELLVRFFKNDPVASRWYLNK